MASWGDGQTRLTCFNTTIFLEPPLGQRHFDQFTLAYISSTASDLAPAAHVCLRQKPRFRDGTAHTGQTQSEDRGIFPAIHRIDFTDRASHRSPARLSPGRLARDCLCARLEPDLDARSLLPSPAVPCQRERRIVFFDFDSSDLFYQVLYHEIGHFVFFLALNSNVKKHW
jgi:hypothetical protein